MEKNISDLLSLTNHPIWFKNNANPKPIGIAKGKNINHLRVFKIIFVSIESLGHFVFYRQSKCLLSLFLDPISVLQFYYLQGQKPLPIFFDFIKIFGCFFKNL